MTKIIVIETCIDCPYLYRDYDEYDVIYVCVSEENVSDPDGIILRNCNHEIPEWCKLKDVSEDGGLIKYKRWLEEKLEDQRIEEYQEQQEQNLQNP